VAALAVCLRITARRFYCRNVACPRRTFRERLPSVAPVYQRRTPLLRHQLERIGFALGGRAGQRIAHEIGLGRRGASRSSLLRLVRQTVLPTVPTPRVLGVDDWSFRRGRTYGTILTDLEQHHVVDLLPDRSAQTLKHWLLNHPGVSVVSRDRAGAYADGARQGAPQALQVADRFHLMRNATTALEQVLVRQHWFLTLAAKDEQPPLRGHNAAGALSTDETRAFCTLQPPPTRAHREREARQARRRARFEQVQALQAQGWSYRAVARMTGLSRDTVTRLARADAPPERRPQSRRPSNMDPFEPYLRERWAQGEHNAAQLFAEIQGQGFPGSSSLIRQRLARWRVRPRLTEEAASRASCDGPPKHAFSPRQTLWLLLGDHPVPAQHQEAVREQTYIARLRELSPTIHQAQDLVVQFRRLLQARDLAGFRAWLPQATRSTVPEVRGFAHGLCRDRSAVEAAFVYTWNNGQVEGQVNRLKMVKRQMFGRAHFDLLKQRVLWAGGVPVVRGALLSGGVRAKPKEAAPRCHLTLILG
jgi:transposase